MRFLLKILIFCAILNSTLAIGIEVSEHYNFTKLDSSNGLSQNEVTGFLEDSRGYMWISTLYGLNIYDGSKIVSFYSGRTGNASLPHSTVYSLCEDDKRRVWIGTDDGMAIYNIEDETMFSIEVMRGVVRNMSIRTLLFDNNTIYVGSNNGLFLFSTEATTMQEINSSLRLLLDVVVVDMHIDSFGNLWVLTQDEILKIDHESGSESSILSAARIENDLIFAGLTLDNAGRLWVATRASGVLVYDPMSREVTQITSNIKSMGDPRLAISSNKCRCIECNDDGNIYVSTQNRGLNVIEIDENVDALSYRVKQITHNPYSDFSLSSNILHPIYFASNNSMWVGSIGSGVNIFYNHNKPFAHYKIPPIYEDAGNRNFIRALCVSSDGMVWIGTHNNGLYHLDLESGKFDYKGYAGQLIHSIVEYDKTSLLVASSDGLHLATRRGKSIVATRKISPYAATDIVASEQSVYWTTSYDGLCRIDLKNIASPNVKLYNRESEYKVSVENCRVLRYMEDRREIWVGTEGGGLNIFGLNEEMEPISVAYHKMSSNPTTISSNYIRSIATDTDGTIWIGTYNGLNRVNFEGSGLSFTLFAQEQGLPNNMIQSIEMDKAGYLWLGTNNGLCRFDRTTHQCLNFSYSDGIQGKEFAEHSSTIDPSGHIYMGGLNGVTIFNPEQVCPAHLQPRTSIIEFRLFDEPLSPNDESGILTSTISMTDSVKLAPNQNNITIYFSALHYGNQSAIKYDYKLEGYDRSWHSTDATSNFAKYNNLPHGTYKFLVKTRSSESVGIGDMRVLNIHIETPILRTNFAKVIYLLIIILTLYILYKLTRSRIAEREHNKQQHEMEYLRSKFFINIAHDLLTPITLICNPLEDILNTRNRSTNINKALTIANNNAKRLRYLVEQMIDIRKSEFGKHNLNLAKIDLYSLLYDEIMLFNYNAKRDKIDIRMEYELNRHMVVLDSDKVTKAIFNLLSNAYKYTRGEIVVRVGVLSHIERPKELDPTRNYIALQVIDTGAGIKPEMMSDIFKRYHYDKSAGGSGIGLSHTKELVEAHEGVIVAYSEVGVGTTMTIYLPNDFVVAESSSTDMVQHKYKKSLPVDTSSTGESGVLSDDAQPTDENTTTMLIIDDNDELRGYIMSIFEGLYTTVESSSADHALTLLEEGFTPHIILCDVMMEGTDGISFCTKIKSDHKTRHIPIIMLTAKIDASDSVEGLKAGADDYVTKPFNTEQLKLKVKNLIRTIDSSRKIHTRNVELNPPAIAVTSEDAKFLNKLMEILEKSLSNSDLMVSDIEKQFNMSHATFYRKVKEATGMSCKEYLQSMRIKRAYHILKSNSGLMVSDVAYMVGFSDSKYFGKCFKRQYNISPSDLGIDDTNDIITDNKTNKTN